MSLANREKSKSHRIFKNYVKFLTVSNINLLKSEFGTVTPRPPVLAVQVQVHTSDYFHQLLM